MSLNTNMFATRARASINAEINSGGSSQGEAERTNVARILRDLEHDEKETNMVIITVRLFGCLLRWHGHESVIKVSAISTSLVWWIVRIIQQLQQATVAQENAQHLVSHFSHVSWTNFLNPPLAPSGSSLLWTIVYWATSLFFGLFAIFVAVIVKKVIRDYKAVLQPRGRPLEKTRTQESLDHGDVVAWFIPVATDTMYRNYQVSLVVLLLGVLNFFLCPVGATIFVPTVILGLYYVFGPSSDQP